MQLKFYHRHFRSFWWSLAVVLTLVAPQGFGRPNEIPEPDPGQTCEVAAAAAGVWDYTAIQKRKVLEIGGLNAENLFWYQGEVVHEKGSGNARVRKSEPSQKPKWKRDDLGRAIRGFAPDLLTVTEVDGENTLDKFDLQHIGAKYETYLLKGNDERGINIGTYVLPIGFHVTRITNKDATWQDPTEGGTAQLYARDAPMTIYRIASDATDENNLPPPFLISFEVHQKSKRDRDGDPQSKAKRAAESANTARLIYEAQVKYGKDTPIYVAGDFNCHIHDESETRPYFSTAGLVDVFDLAKMAKEDRYTHTFHPFGGKTIRGQLDGLLINPALAKYFQAAGIYRYTNLDGTVRPLPDSFKDRDKNPSDHFPYWAKFNNEAMYADYVKRLTAWKAKK